MLGHLKSVNKLYAKVSDCAEGFDGGGCVYYDFWEVL